MRTVDTYLKGMGLGDYLKKVAERLEAAETPREAEVASWFLEATVKTILEEKGVMLNEIETVDQMC